MAQHYGPWRYSEVGYNNEIWSIWNRDNEHVGMIQSFEANARLIAAAPDLLEALQLITDHVSFSVLKRTEGLQTAIVQARKALGKARGG